VIFKQAIFNIFVFYCLIICCEMLVIYNLGYSFENIVYVTHFQLLKNKIIYIFKVVINTIFLKYLDLIILFQYVMKVLLVFF